MIGYKIMRFYRGRAVSMADTRQGFVPKVGKTLRLRPPGMWMALDRQYVLDYYAGNDVNILLTLAFDPRHVTVGNLDDAEPEFAVDRASIVAFEVFEDEDA